MTRKLIAASDALWARLHAFRIAETARYHKPISQAEVVRLALVEGIEVLERKRIRDGDLDDL